MSEHRLESLEAQSIGVRAACTCGWASSGHFSSMSASAAYRTHLEDVERRKKREEEEK